MPQPSSDPIPSITPPQPFTIRFDPKDVEELKSRLSNPRLPDQDFLPALDAKQRSNYHQARPGLEWIKKAIPKWRELDFEAFSEKLNRFPHFTTSVDWCERLHFVHRPSSRSDAIPLILIHGWPGSWYEFEHIIQPLAEPEDPSLPAFHVVVPSLPGFLFSSPPPNKDPGVGDFVGYSRILNALMRGLGYDRYASSAGDWGSPHARCLGANHYSEKDGTGCRAVHLNFCPVSPSGVTKLLRNVLPYTVLEGLAKWVYDKEHVQMIQKAQIYEDQMAYYIVQKLRPVQLSYGLVDSPVGILGWLGYFYDILTEFKPGHPTLNLDSALETITLFHMTKSIGTSFLPYTVNPYLPDIHASAEMRLKVPLAYSDFPEEIVNVPLDYVQKTVHGKVRWMAKSNKGGHFAALEEPKIYINHLRNAFSKGGKIKSDDAKHFQGVRQVCLEGGVWDEVRKEQERAGGKL
ncbi:epoxide hydrolase [Violaceomyces palustris]|uniref:Epoxide hydrolase n=1 Tax=Violaceomyces palustris TaxID=1673888 RepID=A0ACD0NUC1_9BASI|nr:epoxide hydrolase [Violaceomyces palustris]